MSHRPRTSFTTVPYRVNDLELVRLAKESNSLRSSVLDVGTVLDVVLDHHGRVAACGFPDAKQTFLVERRDDFVDVVHRIRQCIRSDAIRDVLSVVLLMNTNRVFSDGEFSLGSLLDTLMTTETETETVTV